MKAPYPAAIAFMLVCAANPVAAQFTAAVVPPDSVRRVDTAARLDSLERAREALAQRLSDMRRWVDSAAAALAATPPPAESAGARPAAPTERDTLTSVSHGDVENAPPAGATFHEGASAPAAATPLPLLALIGAGALLSGVALLRR